MLKLNSANVEKIFRECLSNTENYDAVGNTVISGITFDFAVDNGKIKKATSEINELLSQLPDPFYESNGGGWSFLKACDNNEGQLWTGEHRIMEMLMILGIAVGSLKILMPKDTWKMLPGGMPYFVISDDVLNTENIT